MTKGEGITRRSAEELIAASLRGESETDWARVDAMTEEELERSIAEDPDRRDIPPDWFRDAKAVPAGSMSLLCSRRDPEAIAAQGRGRGR